MQLRNYQTEAKQAIRAAFAKGKRRVILCSPTGSGKTVTFADIARDTVRNGRRVLIVVDRTELLEQSEEKLRAYGLNPSLIVAGKKHKAAATSFIATVQTLQRRAIDFDPDLIIVDEAHKQTFDKLFKRPELANVFTIGATATPYRRGKMTSLASIYGEMVETTTIDALISDGYLMPARTFGPPVDTSTIKHKGGDFDERSAFDAFNKKPLYVGVVDKYKKHTPGTRAVCFCINVEHSELTAAAFNEAGIRAEHLDGGTPKGERRRIIREFKAGVIQVLTNCDILTTGFDDPGIETVIVNRPTESLPLWLQMCGRGSRPASNKTLFNILDMGGNVARLGHWEQPRKWSLDHRRSDKVGVAPVKECPECEEIVFASAKACRCGYIFPEAERKTADAEFAEIKSPIQMPKQKQFINSLDDLLEIQHRNLYKPAWIAIQIKNRPKLFPRPIDTLETVAARRGWSSKWVRNMAQIYFSQTF